MLIFAVLLAALPLGAANRATNRATDQAQAVLTIYSRHLRFKTHSALTDLTESLDATRFGNPANGWRRYELYILAGLCLILAEMMLIFGLLWQRMRRKRVETSLAESNDRLRLALEAGASVAWEWDVKSEQHAWFGDLNTVFGIPSDKYVGQAGDFYRYVHREDRPFVEKMVADARQSQKPYAAEFRVVRLDGAVRWIRARGRFYYGAKGDPERMVGMATDITERKLAENARSESEHKLRLILDSTGEAIYGTDLKGFCTFCNAACLRALGYERVEDLLGKHMHLLIHHTRADGTLLPLEECRVARALQKGESAHVDDEVFWRADGASFPVEYWSYPQQTEQGILGAVVAFVDITQRKLAEGALASVNRRLIEAQEWERTRIARELHDDIGQRLALLVNELERIRKGFSGLPVEASGRLGELQQQALQIANDVQSLSHDLHSSKIEYLGIVAAVRGFCTEFAEQQNIEIDFQSRDMPGTLPSELSLSIFRVMQEALHNSAKYSGVRHIEVRLWGTGDELHLSVSDAGVGFDREFARKSRGLGLVSMEERLKLLKGTLTIESQLNVGTTVHARVPLASIS